MNSTESYELLTPVTVSIQQNILSLISRLKRQRLWKLIDQPTRGWLEIASRLKDIKFRSRLVIDVLIKILRRLNSILRVKSFLRVAGMSRAWMNSVLAESWGNVRARSWRSDPGYQLYCGLVEFQLSKIVPGMRLLNNSSMSGLYSALIRRLRRAL